MIEYAPKIKICGLFREADIDAANEARPDYAGFVCAESRRQVSPELAEKLRGRLSGGIIPVGVFVNAPPETITALYKNGVIAAAQLHGAEDGAYVAALKNRCPGMTIIKTVSVSGAFAEAAAGAARNGADFLLLDNAAAGSGRRFDWSLLRAGLHSITLPWFFAGGIGLENIDEALSFAPYCIDVSSGAETDGFKDPEKMRALVQKTRAFNKEQTA